MGRLQHQRPKGGPASTPAARLIELQQALTATEQKLASAQARISDLERDYQSNHSFQHVSFGGIPMAQHRCDLVLWEELLNANPRLKAIFELGTWFGGMAWWLWAQCQARDMHFETYDMTRSEHPKPPMFVRLDVFLDREQIGEVIRDWEPCVVFCDNGNKPRELREYSQELRSPDSLLVVHDWGTEFLPEDVPDNVVMVYGDFCEQIGSITRVFRLKERHA